MMTFGDEKEKKTSSNLLVNLLQPHSNTNLNHIFISCVFYGIKLMRMHMGY